MKRESGEDKEEERICCCLERKKESDPINCYWRSDRSKYYFDRHGDLKRIKRLKYWPMDWLLVDKDKLPEAKSLQS
ncbi:hypothetical protein YC2023_095970 [Brassica napus]